MKNRELRITPRARRIALEKGLAESSFPVSGSGFGGGVCERDILTLIAEKGVSLPSAEDGGVRGGNDIPRATPLAKRFAAAVNADISKIAGSGARGKVLKADVVDFAEKSAARAPSVPDAASGAHTPDGKIIREVTPYSGVRKIIGTRLAESKFTAPHLYFTQKVDMSALLALRKQVNSALENNASVTDFIVRAVTVCLIKFPDMNASLIGDNIELYESVNVGVAVAAPTGLIVPVLRDCEKKRLKQISEDAAALVSKARDGKLRPDEYSGGTFTVSNLGMFGIENFTAIINPPESAILAVSATKDEVIAADDGNGGKTVVVRPMMNITLTVDHRIIDGLLAANFVTEVKRILENPVETLL
ncbi:MAG: 2-oxo acid dehydrogenase subunit E2 [Clostridiales Family XIII bacterium]|jgi:pyruvate dehydrogenase E2 component (dihydrolipoamide acetyltransferase)|nr:2-oxo acid dehydrogenase subunit E2 [Clostridiales Family XIII bacterium]